MNSGIVILIFTALENLRIFQSCFFTRKADKINCVFGFRTVRQLVAAAAEEAGRGALEQLDVQIVRQHGGKIHHPLLQQTGNAIAHTVNDLCAAVLAALKYACKACIDDGSRTARLTNDCIFTHDDFSFFVFLFRQYNITCRMHENRRGKRGYRRIWRGVPLT